MTQIVVDTNTSVSALLWGGTPQRVFTVAVANSIPLLTSEALVQELHKTLNKPKLAKYVALSGKTPSELVAELVRLMTLVSKSWRQLWAAKRRISYQATKTCWCWDCIRIFRL